MQYARLDIETMWHLPR